MSSENKKVDYEPIKEIPDELLVYIMLTKGDDKEKEILVLQRMNGNYSLPAGHVEEGEEISQAAIREIQEEVGVLVKPEDLSLVHVTYLNTSIPAKAHYFETTTWIGEPQSVEPDKHLGVGWYPLSHLPEPFVTQTKVSLGNIGDGKLISEFPPKIDSR